MSKPKSAAPNKGGIIAFVCLQPRARAVISRLIQQKHHGGNMLDMIFVKGGWVMYVIIVLSTYVLGIILFKAYQFSSGGVFNTGFIDRVMMHVKRGELTDASHLLARERGPLARIMRVAVEGVMNRQITMKSREAEISRVGSGELRYLESHMRGLEMASAIGPLLGLLGTVIGMIAAFSKLAESGTRVDPSMLAGGIWQALIATVGGLCVAVPAMASYYLIDSLIERVRATMRDVTIQILALEDNYIRNEKEQEKREALEREDRVRKLMEDQAQVLANPRGAPQSSGTLHLLNPSYNKF
jgi:biopolymer transport protein ExbB